MIEAKTVIPDQYWILREHDQKIGNIEAESGGYVINLNGAKTRVDNLKMLKQKIGIDFVKTPTIKPKPVGKEVHGYPTTAHPYNAIFDVKHQLPLWTQEPRSRSWLAAGWYRVRQHRDWCVVQCPKLILLERYEYQGPFFSKEEAQTG